MTLSLLQVKDSYFNKIFSPSTTTNAKSNTAGGTLTSNVKAKVLLLDKHTTSIISMCFTQSQLLANDIILIELIESQSQLATMKHLNCIVYIHPCKESIQYLNSELHSPHFGKYQLYLNNCISKNQIESIAEADEFEVIEKVMEIFQDYLIVNDNLYLIEKPITGILKINPAIEESNRLISLLLSLKKTPIIKYESNSLDLKRLSSEILYNINSNSNNNLFDDLNRNSDVAPILLLLDRKNDPITPLLSPWTYQSMIHEFVGISKNIVQLPDTKEQIILSEESDKFYREAMYLNYGDLTEKFQKYVEEYKTQTKQSSLDNLKTQNLVELKQLLTKFPQYRKLSENILKHLNLLSEIDKQISNQSLWEVGELQQDLACGSGESNHSELKSKLMEILESNKTNTINKIKLILLYSIRFHNNPQELSLFISKLNNPTYTNPLPTSAQNELMKRFKTLFSSAISSTHHKSDNQPVLKNIFAKKNIQSLFNRDSNNSGNDNIYLQYTPRLNDILNDLINPNTDSSGHRSSSQFLSTLVPDTVRRQYGNSVGNGGGGDVQDIIIYIKGGVTYEEARVIQEIGQVNKKVHLIIGGDDKILNSNTWISSLYELVSHESDDDEGDGLRIDRQAQLREIL
ncbi:VPS45 [[Candida] subhashii]|uniref:VPS45 n=1 Tax=[Candida] subhashii TaxID=561895 RepID=A0A8J5QFU2_9ASCO|nr:VPS45 [[Candida] subhashii]KAG7660810.1 VPS45 [[Candida] subhashii]